MTSSMADPAPTQQGEADVSIYDPGGPLDRAAAARTQPDKEER